jgi:hypothetical protein
MLIAYLKNRENACISLLWNLIYWEWLGGGDVDVGEYVELGGGVDVSEYVGLGGREEDRQEGIEWESVVSSGVVWGI